MLPPIAITLSVLYLTFGSPINSTGFVHVPLRKDLTKASINTTASSRQTTADTVLTVSGYQYWANVNIGGQPVTCLLDTGSSDTFTFTNKAFGEGWIPGESPDYQWQNDDFRAAFGSGLNRIRGSWATDSLVVGGAEILDYLIGMLNQTFRAFPDKKGILAIGPKSAETLGSKYPPIYERMKTAGITKSQSYSLYVTSSENVDAHLLFGGVDIKKFDGQLQTVPFALSEVWGQTYFNVDWQFQRVWYEGGVLDSGTSYILLPAGVVRVQAEKYGCFQSSTDGLFVASGTPSPDLPPIVITVGGVDVNVAPFFEIGGKYMFALQSGGEGDHVELNILGDPFLRAVYSVFDMENSVYGFAPIRFTDDSEILSIGRSIPNSVPAPDQSTGHTGGGNPGGNQSSYKQGGGCIIA